MAYIKRYQATINVTASGGVSHGIDVMPENGGYLHAIVVRNATALGVITSAKLIIDQGGRTLWDATTTGATNTTVTWYPRTQVHSGTSGAILVENATAPPPMLEKYPIAALVPIHLQITSGGTVSGGGARSVQVDLYIGG